MQGYLSEQRNEFRREKRLSSRTTFNIMFSRLFRKCERYSLEHTCAAVFNVIIHYERDVSLTTMIGNISKFTLSDINIGRRGEDRFRASVHVSGLSIDTVITIDFGKMFWYVFPTYD